ncbi:MAG TPA: lamin tail domain-containing protein [Roseiflexaceae bacterium]|nr:lamin tail domain-containing protein [Roseiflexaceae bacterium]
MASMSLQVAYDQARQWLESNDLDRAIGLAQHILDHYPDNLEAYRILGEAHLANRQLDRAQESFERVLRSDPENIPAHVGLGITYERQSQLDRAVNEFEQALEIKPDMAELRSQLLRLYTEGWGSENAQLRLSRAGLARLYAKGHMLPQAISEFRQVIADQPGRFDAMVALAETLWRDGQEDAAMTLCRDILAQRPESLKANLLLGYLLMTSGDPEGERFWRAAERMDPYHGVARALFETLPPSSNEQPEIEEWDEAAWRQRREAEQQEQIGSTRPMEAVTPIGTSVAAAPPINQLPPRPAPVTVPDDGDDFLASLLAIETPALPSTPLAADVSEEDLGLNIDMAPFSLDSLSDDRPAASQPAPTAPEKNDDIYRTTPFSLAELGLSEDEIAGMDSLSARDSEPAAAPAEPEEPTMTPFSLSDLGLSEDEIAGLNAPETTPATPAEPEEPTMTPFSLSDLGLSEDEIASLNAPETTPATPAEPEEPAMTPFSLSDLGLSEDEIAGMDSLSALDSSAAPTAEPAAAEEDDIKISPFSLSDLGLSDDEIAGLESLRTDAPSPSQPASTTPNAGDEILDMGDLPLDLQPFSIDELDLGASEPSSSGIGELPTSLQPFSLDEPPPQRPRVSGFITPESAENEPISDEEDYTPETRGFSWQQASQKPETSFRKTPQDEPSSDSSIFAKLKQRHQSNPADREPPPLPPVTLEPDEHLGLFSIDDVSLRDDVPPTSAETAAPTEPQQRVPAQSAPAPTPEIENLEEAIASGQVQPFSLADLGLSEEEIAAMGMGTAAAATDAAAPPAQAGEVVIEHVEFDPSGIDYNGEFVLIKNAGARSADLTGWTLHDIGGRHSFTFPPFLLAPGESVRLWTRRGINDAANLYWDSVGAIWNNTGDTAILQDAAGNQQSAYTFEPPPREPAPEPSEPAAPIQPATPMPEIENLEDAVASGQVQPFSLADLGLSDEEIAAMGLGEPAGTQASEPNEPAAAEADQLTLPSEAAPSQEAPAGAEPADEAALLTSDLQPFSLTDLGLSDDEISALGFDTAAEADDGGMGLGLTEEELEGLDGGDLKWASQQPQPEPAASAPTQPEPQLTTGDLVVDRLIALGRLQGYVDIADIMADFEDPEAEAARIEEIGQRLHEAQIEIRDGDEVIDMEAEEEVDQEEAGESEQADDWMSAPDIPPAAPTFPPLDLATDDDDRLGLAEPDAPKQDTDAEPSMTPFSLSELGLSEDEINALGLGEPASTPEPTAPTEQPAEPDMTPFSLSDLGLSDEEINALDFGESTDAADLAAPPAQEAEAEEPEQSQAVPPEAHEQVPEPEQAQPAPTSATPVESPATTPAATPQPRPAAPAAEHGDQEAPIYTGNDIVDGFLHQLEANPQDDVLRISIARIGWQIGIPDLAVQQYKYLIKHNRSLDQVVDEINDLLSDSDEGKLMQRLHRVLGDAYTKQGRFREAVSEYSWTLGGSRGTR